MQKDKDLKKPANTYSGYELYTHPETREIILVGLTPGNPDPNGCPEPPGADPLFTMNEIEQIMSAAQERWGYWSVEQLIAEIKGEPYEDGNSVGKGTGNESQSDPAGDGRTPPPDIF